MHYYRKIKLDRMAGAIGHQMTIPSGSQDGNPNRDEISELNSTNRTIQSATVPGGGDNGGASSQFGHRGNESKKRKRGAFKLTSGMRRSIDKRSIANVTKLRESNNYELRARASIDTMADTVCAGANW